MKEEEYRIVQVSDSTFHVEVARYSTYKYWPWSPPVSIVTWKNAGIPGIPFPFKSEEHAQKWIDDQRKYPIVVKHPA
ncbi:hypothetical protein [Hymenobacter cheonanensis]|uniref:hypothetical protein n=1 Tax=Hymenobacter sp. CA2-7 TaxID=3063993 RepID=UPI002713DCBD|nr:hypothetical protein [Hymenobacter sp. CA2-7]MDO7885356.1 hypothetical protein [Hymenobacter sp. CA2-7]